MSRPGPNRRPCAVSLSSFQGVQMVWPLQGMDDCKGGNLTMRHCGVKFSASDGSLMEVYAVHTLESC